MSCVPCHHTCRTCTDSSATSCTGCYPNATKNLDNSCSCNEGYYNVSIPDPCVTIPCSVCTPCDSSCKSCNDSGTNSKYILKL